MVDIFKRVLNFVVGFVKILEEVSEKSKFYVI